MSRQYFGHVLMISRWSVRTFSLCLRPSARGVGLRRSTARTCHHHVSMSVHIHFHRPSRCSFARPGGVRSRCRGCRLSCASRPGPVATRGCGSASRPDVPCWRYFDVICFLGVFGDAIEVVVREVVMPQVPCAGECSKRRWRARRIRVALRSGPVHLSLGGA